VVEFLGVKTIFPSLSDTFKPFSQKCKYRPNTLNYLNTTFNFGKQTKDNFINRKVQCRPGPHTHFRARFFLG